MKFILENKKCLDKDERQSLLHRSQLIGSVSLGRGRNKAGALFLTEDKLFVMANQYGFQDLPKKEAYPAFIKAFMKAEGFTQEAFSDAYSFPLPTVQSWTSGRRIPSAGLVNLLYRILLIEDK